MIEDSRSSGLYSSTVRSRGATAVFGLTLFALGCGCHIAADPLEPQRQAGVPPKAEAMLQEAGARGTLEPIGMAFPPTKNERQRAFSAKQLEKLGVERIRFHIRWEDREPSPGQFNWQPLDQRLRWARENDLRVLATLHGKGPAWACTAKANENSCVVKDPKRFDRFVTELVTRLRDKFAGVVERIQFGNEWGSKHHYIGSETDYVVMNNILHDRVKELAPDIQVALGSFAITQIRGFVLCGSSLAERVDRPQWLAPQRPINEICRRQSRDVDTAVRRIRHGLSNARFDAIDLHLYDDPQNWGVYIEAFRQIIGDDVEVIVSEFGGPHPSIKEMRVEEQAKLLVESIVALAEQGIRSAYFFKLVEGPKYPHPISGLMKAERAGALPNVKAPMFEAVAAYNRMTSEARQKPPTKPIEQP